MYTAVGESLWMWLGSIPVVANCFDGEVLLTLGSSVCPAAWPLIEGGVLEQVLACNLNQIVA